MTIPRSEIVVGDMLVATRNETAPRLHKNATSKLEWEFAGMSVDIDVGDTCVVMTATDISAYGITDKFYVVVTANNEFVWITPSQMAGFERSTS